MYSSDPNVVEETKLLEKVSYDEMLEAATAGAKVLHNRAAGMAKKYKMKVTIKNTRNDAEGTLVYKGEDNINESAEPKILAIEKELAKISIVGQDFISNPEYIVKIYSIAKENNIVIHILSLSDSVISLIIKEKDAKEFANILHEKLILNK